MHYLCPGALADLAGAVRSCQVRRLRAAGLLRPRRQTCPRRIFSCLVVAERVSYRAVPPAQLVTVTPISDAGCTRHLLILQFDRIETPLRRNRIQRLTRAIVTSAMEGCLGHPDLSVASQVASSQASC